MAGVGGEWWGGKCRQLYLNNKIIKKQKQKQRKLKRKCLFSILKKKKPNSVDKKKKDSPSGHMPGLWVGSPVEGCER